jgi:hypothetical protein
MRVVRSKWFLPLFAVALGMVVFVAQWIGGDPGSGLVSFAIVAGFGLLVLLGGRSETIRGLARRRPRRTLSPDRHPRHRDRRAGRDQRVHICRNCGDRLRRFASKLAVSAARAFASGCGGLLLRCSITDPHFVA